MAATIFEFDAKNCSKAVTDREKPFGTVKLAPQPVAIISANLEAFPPVNELFRMKKRLLMKNVIVDFEILTKFDKLDHSVGCKLELSHTHLEDEFGEVLQFSLVSLVVLDHFFHQASKQSLHNQLDLHSRRFSPNTLNHRNAQGSKVSNSNFDDLKDFFVKVFHNF